MSTTRTHGAERTTRALEETANDAREALAENMEVLGERARHAADVAQETERVARSSSPIAPIVAGAALTFAAGSFTRGLARYIGRAAIGAAAGVLAGLAMDRFDELWAFAEKKLGGRRRESARRARAEDVERTPAIAEKPATVKAAERVIGPIAPERQEHAGMSAHFVMAGTTGAIYGLLAHAVPRVGLGRGLAYGMAVWLVADETMVPILRLSRPPWEYSTKTHVRALLAHLVYGAVLDVGIRGASRIVRRALSGPRRPTAFFAI